MDKDIQKQADFRLQSKNPKRRLVKLNLLFKSAVGGVVARKDGNRSVGYPLQQSLDVFLAPQRRIHFEIRIVALQRCIAQGDVVRAHLAAKGHAPTASLAQDPYTSRSAQVLAVNRGSCQFRQHRVPLHDQFFTRSGPSRQTQNSDD
jgi:hypothetical protein